MLNNISHFIVPLLVAIFLAVLFTLLMRLVAKRWEVIDRPTKQRKVHKQPIPLLGGLAMFLAFALTIIFYIFWDQSFFTGYMSPKYIIGILLGGLILMIGGVLDDKFNLSPGQLIIWPITASVVIIASGIGLIFFLILWEKLYAWILLTLRYFLGEACRIILPPWPIFLL